MAKSTDYERCKKAFDKNWIDLEGLKVWVVSGKITPKEFEEIAKTTY